MNCRISSFGKFWRLYIKKDMSNITSENMRPLGLQRILQMLTFTNAFKKKNCVPQGRRNGFNMEPNLSQHDANMVPKRQMTLFKDFDYDFQQLPKLSWLK